MNRALCTASRWISAGTAAKTRASSASEWGGGEGESGDEGEGGDEGWGTDHGEGESEYAYESESGSIRPTCKEWLH